MTSLGAVERPVLSDRVAWAWGGEGAFVADSFGNYEPKMLRFRRVFSEKVAREKFRFGARFFSFPRQKKKVYAPRFSDRETQKKSAVNHGNAKNL